MLNWTIKVLVWLIGARRGQAREMPLRHTVKTKAPLRVQFLQTFFLGEGGKMQEATALLSKKKGGREGSIESQQKFDFFSYDFSPKESIGLVTCGN